MDAEVANAHSDVHWDDSTRDDSTQQFEQAFTALASQGNSTPPINPLPNVSIWQLGQLSKEQLATTFGRLESASAKRTPDRFPQFCELLKAGRPLPNDLCLESLTLTIADVGSSCLAAMLSTYFADGAKTEIIACYRSRASTCIERCVNNMEALLWKLVVDTLDRYASSQHGSFFEFSLSNLEASSLCINLEASDSVTPSHFQKDFEGGMEFWKKASLHFALP